MPAICLIVCQRFICSRTPWLSRNALVPVICKNSAYAFSTTNFPALHAKKTVPFDYVREKKPHCINASGDKEQLKQIDLSRPTLEFESCQNIENAGDIVQKLISLKYAPRNELVSCILQEYIKLVRRHPLDTHSTEVKIASLTVRIRSFQQLLSKMGKCGTFRVRLKEMIDKRKQLLKTLRKEDIKRFEWLLEVLNIEYMPPPLFYHWTTRKGTLRNLTREHCIKLRKEKIDEYRAKLKSQQAEFLDEKEKILNWAQKITEELQLTPEEKNYIEQQQLTFKIPIFPKHLSFKKPILEHIKLIPEKI